MAIALAELEDRRGGTERTPSPPRGEGRGGGGRAVALSDEPHFSYAHGESSQAGRRMVLPRFYPRTFRAHAPHRRRGG